ncbi:MAG TPA: class I SAM-dependent methyltransferase [Alphaproteobacteria bacterium]|nr:class I SAM-dependent methyltransferase [Alphaproteobacteria bacterium]
MREAEFDKFADEYDALLRDSVRASGEDPAYFAEYKVRDVAGVVAATATRPLRILDFGSGSGGSIGYFRRYFPSAELVCLDVSRKSLALARRRAGGLGAFVCFDGETIPFGNGSFDVVFTACVFHHIPAERHMPLLGEIRRVLRPNGSLFLFEHNPLNPLTRRAVDSCAFDREAVLIGAGEMAARARAAGFGHPAIAYRIFFPRAFAALRPLERFLTRVPLGAQYRLHATA